MKELSTPLLAAVLASLLLSACDKAPEPAVPPMPAVGGALADRAPLDRNLDPTQVAHGRAIYDRNCATCHGAEGKGPSGDWHVRNADGTFPPPPLDDGAHAWHHPTAVLLDVIRNGSPGGAGNMPAWKDRLSAQELQDVVVYIKSLWSDPVYRLWMKMERQSLER
ncbi:MAG: c-type cytochrome [Thiobacillus sp.]